MKPFVKLLVVSVIGKASPSEAGMNIDLMPEVFQWEGT
jgi:hypothetical protein